MKFILVFSINIIFANILSEWTDSNNHIINSESYKISFKQEYEATIGESTHYSSNPESIIYFNNNIKYESDDKVIIINQDSLKMLNKYSNQIFINNTDEMYSTLLSLKLSEVLLNNEFIEHKGNNYYYISNNDTNIKIYFSDKSIDRVIILYNDITIKLSDIQLSIIDTNQTVDYLKIGNDLSEIFDLRAK